MKSNKRCISEPLIYPLFSSQQGTKFEKLLLIEPRFLSIVFFLSITKDTREDP